MFAGSASLRKLKSPPEDDEWPFRSCSQQNERAGLAFPVIFQDLPVKLTHSNESVAEDVYREWNSGIQGDVFFSQWLSKAPGLLPKGIWRVRNLVRLVLTYHRRALADNVDRSVYSS